MSLFKAQVQITHSVLGGIGTNGWSLRTTGSDPGDAPELDGLMEIVQAFYTSLNTVLATSTTVSFDGVCREIGGDETENTDAGAWTVGITGAAGVLPPANCICVTWRAATGGRSGKGRSFLGPIKTDALQTDGTVDTAELTTVRNGAAALVAASEGFTNGALGVWSYKDEVFRDYVGSSVTDQFAVLRSRRD